MKLLFEFISFLNEAESDIKQLKKLNMGALYDRDPKAFNDLTIDERERLSSSGPKFSAATISAIEKMDDRQLPHRGRKQFVTWLANEIESYHDFHDEDARMIVDWINVVGIQQLHGLSFDEAMDKSYRWHYEQEQKQNAELSIKHRKEDIVFKCDDGYTIVRVPSCDLSDEGTAMGHCVAGYGPQVDEGTSIIFSLRDPKGRSHVTVEIEVSDNVVTQIKGKGNKPPTKQKHADDVKEWLKTTKYNYVDCPDYESLLNIDEVRKLLRTTKSPLHMTFNSMFFDKLTDDDLRSYIDSIKKNGNGASCLQYANDSENQSNGVIFERIEKLLFKSDDVDDRIAAIMGGSVEIAMLATSDPDPTVRLVTAQMLNHRAMISPSSSIIHQLLAKLCDDDDDDVANAAIPKKKILMSMPNTRYQIAAAMSLDQNQQDDPYYIPYLRSGNDQYYHIVAAPIKYDVDSDRLFLFYVRFSDIIAKTPLHVNPRVKKEIDQAIKSGEIPTI